MRPGAPWCTQCYAPTGPVAEPAAPVAAARAAADPLAAAPSGVTVAERPPAAAGTWPCTTCGQANDLVLPACEGCGTPFLAAVRSPAPTVVLPVVGDLLVLTPVRRVGVAVGLVVAFLVVTALLALLLS